MYYLIVLGFECLFHSEFSVEDRKEFQHLIELYSPAIDRHNIIAELKMWKIKLASSSHEITKNGLDALLNCNKEIYPNIYLLLKIFVTLPVSTATPERSFSSLKRLKTHLRNTMNEVILLIFIMFVCVYIIMWFNFLETS